MAEHSGRAGERPQNGARNTRVARRLLHRADPTIRVG